MDILKNIQHTIAPELSRLHEHIQQALASDNPLMTRIIEGYLETKGKMIRPILVILSARMLGTTSDNVIAAAAAVEMLHNASLIHDDVVDEARMRRDRDTINAKWDNRIAVLMGDFFVSAALQQAVNTHDLRIVGALGRLGRLLSIGEIDQICNARYHNLDEEAYFGVISRKTASLFVACVEMGGYAVGASDAALKPLCEYAEALGRCFQIRDDIFDYFDSAVVGKPTGNDLREGKITLPLLHALTSSTTPERADMLELTMREELDDSQIHTLIDFAKEQGGIDYAYSTMERLRQQACSGLCSAFPDSPERQALLDIFNYIIAREY